jgi:hypothetical protein
VAELAAQLDALGIAVAQVDALAVAAVESYKNASWREADPQQIARMGHLVEIDLLVRDASQAAVIAAPEGPV